MYILDSTIFRLLCAGVFVCWGAFSRASSPPPDFELTLGLGADPATTMYTDHGHELHPGDGLNDPGVFQDPNDCDCYDGETSNTPFPECTWVNIETVCFCPTIAQTHYLLYIFDDLPPGTRMEHMMGLDYLLRLPGSSADELFSASIPRVIANNRYPGEYGYNFGYDRGTETATRVTASFVPNALRIEGDNLQLMAEQRTSDTFPWERCQAYHTLGFSPHNIWVSNDYSEVVDFGYLDLLNLTAFPPIELVSEDSGQAFVYQPTALVNAVDGPSYARIRVRYGDPCLKEQLDALGQCPRMEPERNLGGEDCSVGSFHGNPVNIALGNKYQRETDYSAPGVLPLIWERHYNSVTGRWTSINRVLHEQGSAIARLERADGRITTWTRAGSEWISYPDVRERLYEERDSADLFAGWRIAYRDGLVEIFGPDGELLEQRHRAGYTLTFDHLDPFLKIIEPTGHGLIVSYDNQGRQSTLRTPAELLTYHYDTQDRLIAVVRGDGSQRSYRYADPRYPLALTSIINELGIEESLWTYDNAGRAVTYAGANGSDRITMDYTRLDDLIDPSATLTNALGKQTTYHFIDQHGVRKVKSVEGHASANCAAANRRYEYDDAGDVIAEESWEGRRTEYLRDEWGRTLEKREAVGTSQERITRTTWHATWDLPETITKDGRFTTYEYDATGNLIRVEHTATSN